MEESKKKGGAGLGQGRKRKSGEFVQFRPSQIVADILREKKNKTEFIEKSVLFYEDYLSVKIVSAEEFS
jgi:hypothetical protein